MYKDFSVVNSSIQNDDGIWFLTTSILLLIFILALTLPSIKDFLMEREEKKKRKTLLIINKRFRSMNEVLIEESEYTDQDHYLVIFFNSDVRQVKYGEGEGYHDRRGSGVDRRDPSSKDRRSSARDRVENSG